MKWADVSPLAAMVTGKGAMGKAMAQGFGGMIPMMIARDARDSAEAEEKAAKDRAASVGGVGGVGAEGATKMRKGGKVSSASSRGDGIAQRGKTKGRMI